jgi:hypothetical protein
MSQACQLDPLNHFGQRAELAEDVSALIAPGDAHSWAQFQAEAIGRLIAMRLDYAQLFV